MPNITATGTYDKDTSGFSMLAASTRTRTLSFNDVTSLGTTCEIKATNDAGTDFTVTGGTITAATDINIHMNTDLKIVITGGSPDFNLSIYPE